MDSSPRNILQKKMKTKKPKHNFKGLSSASRIQKAKYAKYNGKQPHMLKKKRLNLLRTSTPKQATLISSDHFKNKMGGKSKHRYESQSGNTFEMNLFDSTKKMNGSTDLQNHQQESDEKSDFSSFSESEENYIKEYFSEPNVSNLLSGYKEVGYKTKGNATQSNILRNFSKDESDFDMELEEMTSISPVSNKNKRLYFTPHVNLDGKKSKNSIFSLPSKNTLIVILDKGCSLSFEGLVNIQVITGTISILGVELSYGMSPVSAYSSLKHCYLNVEAISSELVWKNNALIAKLKRRLEAISSKETAVDVISRYTNSSIIFTLEKKQPSMALNFVRIYMPKVFHVQEDKFSDDTQWLKPYDINASLKQMKSIDLSVYEPLATKVTSLIQISKLNLTPAPRILVYGIKNSGKSTFLRYLVNVSLQKFDKVCYLDCDPGQTEFTVPGCVSLTEVTSPLIGPPCTHLKNPLMSVFIGNTTAESSPEMYCNSVLKLVEHYKTNYGSYPLFINTMGWLTGIGAECLTRAINAALPTLLLELIPEDDLSSYKYVPPQNTEEIPEHISIIVPVFPLTRVPPALVRNLAILSYFGKCLQSSDQLMPLNAIEPYSICWDNLALYVFDTYVSPDKLPEAMNASLVALCRVDESLILSSHIYSYPKTLQGEPENECFGFGIIRAMHQTKHLFYIVTPVPMEKLKMVNALLKGRVAVPSELFLKQDEIVNIQVPYTKVVAEASRDHRRRSKKL